MYAHRHTAKLFLEQSIKDERDRVLERAALTKRQLEIVELKRDMYSWEVADELGLSQDAITKELGKIHDKVYKVLKSRI